MTGARPAVGFAELRAEFPLLDERAYFDSQCLGPMPRAAWADFDLYAETLRLRSRALEPWLVMMDEVTGLCERLLAAPAGAVALRSSATDAQASIASAIEPRPGKDRIVISKLDFHASRYLWRAQARRGFTIVEVGQADAIELSAAEVAAAIDDRTAIVALALVSPRSGALLDAAPIIAAAHAHGAIVVLDMYQGAGIVPVDAPALGVDAVVGGTHKWLGGGGTGLAFLYVRPDLAARLEPAYPGWIGHARLLEFADGFEPAAGARRFQTGTPAMEPIYTARAGLRVALATGVDRIRARQVELLDRMVRRGLARGLAIRAPRDPHARAGFVRIDTPLAEPIAAALRARAIDVDMRPGVGLRVGPHFCHRDDECDAVIDAIADQAVHCHSMGTQAGVVGVAVSS